jgi:fatty-acyl-CoA synthase
MNIIDPILYQCRRQPPAAAICVPGPRTRLISYRRLERSIHNATRKLHASGLLPGSVVAIGVKDLILHVVVMLAAMRLGMITVSLPEKATSLAVSADALVCDPDQPPVLGISRIFLADETWLESESGPLAAHLLPNVGGDDPCRLILTSGTSSTPKAVAFSHDLVAQRMARHVTFGNLIANFSRIYCDLPVSSSLGFQFLIHTLWRGGIVVFAGDDFPSTLRAIQDYNVRCMLGSPGGFENFLRWVEATPNYQSDIELIVSAGDSLSVPLLQRLRSRICSHLLSIYGSTEASMTAVANAHEIAGEPRAVGYVTPGVTVQIVDEAGTLLPADEEGQLRIRSEFAVDGYFRNPEESAKVFRQGWFYPGDQGTLSAEGLLVITGRQHAVLNLGGDKISAEAIELVLTQLPGVLEAAAVAVPNVNGVNEVWAVVVAGEQIDEPTLRAYCETRLSHQFAPVKYVFAKSLPHNENGKLDRRRVLEQIAAPSATSAQS